jgi:hypothetical protein
MNFASPKTQAANAPAPIATPAEATRIAVNLLEMMDTLIDVLQQETDLMRAGHLSAAGKLEAAKSDLTRRYVAGTLQLQASPNVVAQIPPETLATMRARHDGFRALLQINLTVLATAHAVSEGIVRGVSGEMARKAAPQTYGASGACVAPSRSAGQPLALSRML